TTWQRIRRTYGYIAGGPESGVWRSTDGGATWKRSQAGLPTDELGRVGIARSPVNPDVVYAILETGGSGAGGRGGLHRSRGRGGGSGRLSPLNTDGLHF